MAMPFLGILSYFTTTGDYQRIQLNSEYRIERTRKQALSMQRIYVYEKRGILEKNICRPNYSQIVNEILYSNGSNSINTELLPIKNAKLIQLNKDVIEIEYEILNKKKSLNHKLDKNEGY